MHSFPHNYIHFFIGYFIVHSFLPPPFTPKFCGKRDKFLYIYNYTHQMHRSCPTFWQLFLWHVVCLSVCRLVGSLLLSSYSHVSSSDSFIPLFLLLSSLSFLLSLSYSFVVVIVFPSFLSF